MAYKDLVNACAQVVGGSHPDSAHTSIPAQGTDPNTGASDLRTFWYSGADAADGTGVPPLVGAWSRPVEKIDRVPVAMILPDMWEPTIQTYPLPGKKYRLDVIYVRIFVGDNDLATLSDLLYDFADSVPDAFDHHMQLFNTVGVTTADCSRGQFLEVDWGGAAFLAVEFRVQIDRVLAVNRVA